MPPHPPRQVVSDPTPWWPRVAGRLIRTVGWSAILLVAGSLFLLLTPARVLARLLLPVSLGAIAAVALGAWWRSRVSPPGRDSDPVRHLRADLLACRKLRHVDPRLGEQALRQFEQNQAALEQLLALLEARFDRTELAYTRYLGVAEAVHAAVLESGREVVHRLRHLESMRPAELAAGLRRDPSPALQERLEVARHTEAEIRDRLDACERALTGLDRVLQALAGLRTTRNAGGADLEALAVELEALADRARKYAR